MSTSFFQRFTSIVLALLVATTAYSPVFAAPPDNDSFVGAESIASLPFHSSVDITDATNEPNEPVVCAMLAKSVWYSYSPAANTLVRAAIQTNIGFGIMNVFQANGSGIENLSFRTCQSSSPYTFLAETGQTYYFQVGTLAGFDGIIEFDLEAVPPPSNDNFVGAINIGTAPVTTNFDIGGATLEDGEPNPSCLSGSPFFESVWYVFTPSESALLSATVAPAGFSPVMGVYNGTSLDSLTELGCGGSGNTVTFQAIAGQTYYFQLGSFFPELGSGSFVLEPTPPPVAAFSPIPWNPSRFDTIQFSDQSYDPGNIGIETWAWDFGDGSTDSSPSPSHMYATDGDYQVQLSITTFDGRTASITVPLEVRTHDVAIVKMNTPKTASVEQTRTITIAVRNHYYPESVTVDLYRSTADGGFERIASSTQYVPVRLGSRTTEFIFNYTFTPFDGEGQTVVFLAIATVWTGPDAVPADNERYSAPTRVGR